MLFWEFAVSVNFPFAPRAMSLELRQRLFAELDQLVLVDPHTHINPHEPASKTLADILGYHYYTELAHSAGMPKAQIEEPGLDPKEKVRRLVENLSPIQNTIQYSWLVEMCQAFFGLGEEAGAKRDAEITPQNWEAVYDAAARKMAEPDWVRQVLAKSRIEAVFLTNEFDDPLEGFDTSVYIPCLRTDDLVFHLAKREVRERLERASGVAPSDAGKLRQAIAALFQHFKSRGARACAISLPPDFAPTRVSPARVNTALAAIQSEGTAASESHLRSAANYVFWTLAEMCDAFKLPFDLMIGVNRGVYEAGVHQGRDLYDSRVSLIQYKELLNAFPGVTFPISVLASVTNQELTSYAWIFPNVVTHGHWWYSNTPTYIEHDLAARLEAVPQTKQIGYYSDMYKLEFALPKFAMFKRILAKVLAERFVIDRNWSEERALSLGKQVLRSNVESTFRWGDDLREEMPDEELLARLPAALPSSPSIKSYAMGAITAKSEPSLGGLGVLGFETPQGTLRPSDASVVIPVPQEESDDEIRFADGARAAAADKSGEPPPLEIVEDSGDLELDLEAEADAGAAGIHEDELQVLGDDELVEAELEPMPNDAGEELTLEDPDHPGLRETEPFPPANPPSQDAINEPNRYEDQWGFLTRDDKKK
jgi:glucuronate isomerase